MGGVVRHQQARTLNAYVLEITQICLFCFWHQIFLVLWGVTSESYVKQVKQDKTTKCDYKAQACFAIAGVASIRGKNFGIDSKFVEILLKCVNN